MAGSNRMLRIVYTSTSMYVVLPYMFEHSLKSELEPKNTLSDSIAVLLYANDILIIFNGLPKVVAQPLAAAHEEVKLSQTFAGLRVDESK